MAMVKSQDSRSRPATSPAVCTSRPATSLAVCSTGSEFTLANTPREVVIRSRCLMQRSPAGPKRMVLPRELVPVSSRIQHDNNGEACTSKSRCVRSTLFVGEGAQTVPVELVSAQRAPKRQITGRAGARPPTEQDTMRHEAPLLTPELRSDLKQRLDSIVSVCRTDFSAHPRSVRFFLRELWEVCQLLKVPISTRPYRRQLAGPLYQFVLNIPNWPPADLAPSIAELSEDSFITLSVMLAVDSIPWEFRFNKTTYRLCNCATAFGSRRCLLPTGRLRPSEFATNSARPTPRPGKRQQRASSAPSGDQLQGELLTDRSVVGQRRDLPKQERHLAPRLLDVSAALRVRFHEFVQQVPVFLEDLLKCTVEKPVAEQLANQRLLWERWANLVISEISAFDKCYTQFERLYMTIVQQLMETTLEPLRSMANTCDALLSTSGDPFREVQAASLCQRLGLLKQNVDFGGSNSVVHFDSALLEKAHRVLQMETYAEVQEMARVLLQDFDALCKVLLHLNENQVKPELKENAELTSAVLKLEQVWVDCQFVLHQGCLDFIEVLEQEVLSQLSAQLRWQIRVALFFFRRQTAGA